MCPEVRIALVVLALALAIFPAWLAGRIVSRNLTALSWKRMQGVVFFMASDDYVEVELGGKPDAASPRVKVPIDHQIGLSFLKKVPVYVDPTDPSRMRMGGLFQMWLWPTGLALAAALLLSGAGVAARIGRHSAEIRESSGRWMFSVPPPRFETDIRVYRPPSEWKVPLFWSLLGLAALLCGVLNRSGTQIQRVGLSSVGIAFILLMWALALDNKTTEISADPSGMRKTTAFGWCHIRWQQLGSVEKQNTVFGRGRSILPSRGSRDSFPGREVTTIVFADHSGRALMRMSQYMQPRKAVRRLFDLCAERTGLRMEFRRIYNPNL